MEGLDHSVTYPTDIPGFAVRRNSLGYCILELDFIADPDKRSKAWRIAERKKYKNERDWRRQMCVRGSTRILTASLEWLPARDIEPGDELIGFDESLKHYFKYRRAVVETNDTISAKPVKVITTEGTITVSEGHRFVIRRRDERRRRQTHIWCDAEELKPNDLILFLDHSWQAERTYEAGWMAGFMDGEGFISGKEIGVAQNPGPTLERARRFLEDRGYHSYPYDSPGTKPNNLGVVSKVLRLRIAGTRERLRFLGTVRPGRLIQGSAKLWEGRSVILRDGAPNYAKVRSVHRFENQESFHAISTSTATLIADGFFSHNCRDWTTAAGEAFYPEFQADPKKYVHRITHLLNVPMVRGWDFGFRMPACCFMQAAPNGRVAIIREVMPDNINTWNFRDLVRYLSGQIPFEELQEKKRIRAMQWVNYIKESKWLPDPPWFQPGMYFMDYSGPECYKVSDLEQEGKARNVFDIMGEGGIHLNVFSARPSAREEVFRNLMQMRDDGLPGLLLDPTCRWLISGLAGGIAYPKKGSIKNPLPDEPAKDGFFEHLHDAAGYALVNISTLAVFEDTARKMEWFGRIEREVEQDSESLNIHEARNVFWD